MKLDEQEGLEVYCKRFNPFTAPTCEQQECKWLDSAMELLESCVTFNEFYINYFTDAELTLNSYI